MHRDAVQKRIREGDGCPDTEGAKHPSAGWKSAAQIQTFSYRRNYTFSERCDRPMDLGSKWCVCEVLNAALAL